MGDVKNADRSSIEIRTLVRKLHPEESNHNDRVRRLNKFRNYVMGDNKSKPEFYDDDIPLLWLGSSAPDAYLDEDAQGMYGLLQACGTPSEDHKGTLKRSARHAMNLLKWLLLDWKEQSSHKPGDLNLFAVSFLSLPATAYHHMNMGLHLTGGKGRGSSDGDRGGAKEDTCQVIVLILTKHMAEDGTKPQPVTLEELMTSPKAQQEFELWSARHVTASDQELIKKNSAARQAELAIQQRQDALSGKLMNEDMELGDDSDHHHDDHDHDDHHHDDGGGADGDDDLDDDDADAARFDDTGDVLAVMRHRQTQLQRQLRREAGGAAHLAAAHGVATRWEDSLLAREQRARAATAAQAGQHETVRDSQKAAQEMADRKQEKLKAMGKDPLGIVSATNDAQSPVDALGPGGANAAGGPADLQTFDANQSEQLEQALHELQQIYLKAEAVGAEELIKRAAAQKESLEALIERMGGMDALESPNNPNRGSILPINPNFDPILFLTLVHRTTQYDTLIKSMGRLSHKAETHAEQLQNLVRDNFPLFVRCAEGFEEFRQRSESEVGMGGVERVDKLEAIAESCAWQAKKSFKPLLDNTNEVRKVQTAMAVLGRVAPILQVPSLMRQHIDNRRYSQAIKTYRRVLVIEPGCRVELLNQVKAQAEQCVIDARRALERRLALSNSSEEDLVHGMRDLAELLELDVPSLRQDHHQDISDVGTSDKAAQEERGVYEIGGSLIGIRGRPPALGCLLLQAAHFQLRVKEMLLRADESCQRIFSGESLSSVQNELSSAIHDAATSASAAGGALVQMNEMADRANQNNKTTGTSGSGPGGAAGNQWKYDLLEARVTATIQAVDMARIWLPRLVLVGKSAREDEKRRAARSKIKNPAQQQQSMDENQLSAFEVFVSNVVPALMKLVEHAAFCALGSSPKSGGGDIPMTFGKQAPEKLHTILRSPLPPTQSNKVGKELAHLVELLADGAAGARTLAPDSDGPAAVFHLSPLDECKALGDAAVVSIEKRRCIYAFDVCARACANRASGSGKLDADALKNCLQSLSEQLSRPEECSGEVDRGCELVVRRSCEGLASFVRDRDDSARLSAVAECADFLSDRITEIVQEASYLTSNGEAVQSTMMEDLVGLESAMFDEYLENIRQSVSSSVRMGWLEKDLDNTDDPNAVLQPSFPPYLSSSLLAIVRCRAQVEQALGNKVRKSEGMTYQHLSLSTVADGVVQGICSQVMKRKLKLKVRQADRLANELEFLRNTLKKFLNTESLTQLETVLRMVSSKAGRGRGYQGDGPDGLAALEELERLGRVYVLCLAD